MSERSFNHRQTENEVSSLFLDRWSPRAFREDALSRAQIDMLFEAARWAPSCYNEQPWRFVYALSADERARLVATLHEQNQLWARHAPLLLYVLARRHFARNGNPNRHAVFDAGAAWMALALQARFLGLYTHAMAGFDLDKARALLQVDTGEYEIMAAVAVGYRGDPRSLPEELRRIEQPNGRKPPAEVATGLDAFLAR